MKTVGVSEAKTHLAQLLDDVERGEEITITRHGRPVAKLIGARRRARPGSGRGGSRADPRARAWKAHPR